MLEIIRLLIREKFINTFGFEPSTDTLNLILQDLEWNGTSTIIKM